MDCSPPGSSVHWDSPGKNTGVCFHALLQGIFPTQRSNPGVLHCRWILYHLSHQGSLRILEWVGYPFSRGSSWPRNQTRVSCITGRFLTSWATREAHLVSNTNQKGNFWGEFGKIKTGGRVLQQRRKECAENLCRYFPAGPVWLRLWAPVQGAQVQSLVRELEPIRGNEQSTCHSKDPAWCN